MRSLTSNYLCILKSRTFLKYLFIWLRWGLIAAYRILVPWQEIEPAPPAVGAQSLSLLTTREVPGTFFYITKRNDQNQEVNIDT